MSYDIKISSNLLNSTLEFLDSLDADDFAPETIQLFGYVLYAFRQVKVELDLREAFNILFYSQDGRKSFKDCLNHASEHVPEPL
jgi:hypothetical protein